MTSRSKSIIMIYWALQNAYKCAQIIDRKKSMPDLAMAVCNEARLLQFPLLLASVQPQCAAAGFRTQSGCC